MPQNLTRHGYSVPLTTLTPDHGPPDGPDPIQSNRHRSHTSIATKKRDRGERGRSHGSVGVLPGLPVRVGHGELVLIGEQRRRHGVGGRAHGRRHPREGAVAVGVGVRARGRRRRRRHPHLPPGRASGESGRWLGFAWLEGSAGEAAPGPDGGGRKTTGDRKEAEAEKTRR